MFNKEHAQDLFSLGALYPSDFLALNQQPRCQPVDLKMVMDVTTGLVRLEKTTPTSALYGKYWYRSSINPAMKHELNDIVQSILNKCQPKKGDMWLDIACNDGTLLSYVPQDWLKIGIDPADDSFLQESRMHANVVVQDFFSQQALQKHNINKKARVVTCIAMFYDLENPDVFLDDILNVLTDDGMFVCQLSYTPLMLEQLAFDNICHEHIFYYTLDTLYKLFEQHNLTIIDVELNTVNGGSIRVYAVKSNSNFKSNGSQMQQDVGLFRVKSLLQYEHAQQYNTPQVWETFFQNLEILKAKTYNFIKTQRSQGKTVWAYGASTKGNTLLQYFGLDNTLIDGIAERSEYKYGLRTVGTNIPIYSEQEMRQQNPDYLLILPWHFLDVFIDREKTFLENGGKFIVPCPNFTIIGKG
tara:strand:+ start:2466 stop:3704 length:1239 start_codon:yes stop_codon:yes gene_type:complete